MKLKKIAAMLLTGAMVVGTLAACGGSADEEVASSTPSTDEAQSTEAPAETQDVDIKVWVPEEEIDITQAMIDSFDEAHDEYNINAEIAITGIDESAAALQTDTDTAADIFMLPSGSITGMTDAGMLLPLAKGIDDLKKEMPQSAMEAVTRDDMVYAVPYSLNSYFLYYNKDLFTEDEVKSLDTIMDKDLGDGIYNFSFSMDNSWYDEMFFYAAGCTLFGEDGTDPTDCTFNNADGVRAAEYMIDLAQNKKFILDKDGAGGAAFREGKVGAICGGAWACGTDETSYNVVLGDKLGAVPLPTVTMGGKEGQLANFMDFKTFAVKSNTKYPAAAQELAVYFVNNENAMTRYKECGDIPCNTSLATQITDSVAAPALIGEADVAVNQPSITQIDAYWDPMKAFGEWCLSPDADKAKVQEQLDALVASILE